MKNIRYYLMSAVMLGLSVPAMAQNDSKAAIDQVNKILTKDNQHQKNDDRVDSSKNHSGAESLSKPVKLSGTYVLSTESGHGRTKCVERTYHKHGNSASGCHGCDSSGTEGVDRSL